MRTIPPEAGSPRRLSQRGQSMVEFALVAPIFFGLVVGVVDAGLLMFSVNAADHSALMGSEQVAADYNGQNPAWYTWCSPGPSCTVTADDLAAWWMTNTGLGSTQLTTVSDYKVWQTDAQGTRLGPVDIYDPATRSWNNGWPPISRNSTNQNADYAELDIDYSYQSLFGLGPALNLTAKRYFRLEPQTP